MIIVAMTDIHGRTHRMETLCEELSQADWVVLLGDLTHFGGEAPAATVIEAVAAINPHVLAIAGNCDYPAVRKYLTVRDVSLEGRCRVIEGVGFVGLGGSLPCPASTPYELSEAEIASGLESAARDLPHDVPMVLAVHEPPRDTLVDRARRGGHVGSRSVRDFILQRHPVLCLCGHIHEAFGADRLESTLVINPGPLRDGRFVRILLTKGVVEHYELRQIE